MSFLKVAAIDLNEAGNAILTDIDFTQQKFQKIAIAGETGSGKSTLLQTIAGLVQPTSGEVIFENRRVKGPHEQLIPGHSDIAYLTQQFELARFLRVEQVLKYANKLTEAEAETLYKICKIDHLLTRKTDQLSGGERQRIALARLLLGAPKLLLLDEPYSNLDRNHKNILKSVIHDIGEVLEITCILISHDPMDTLSWADEIMVMKAGKMVQKGTPMQIYQQPISQYVASLFGSYNLIPAAKAKLLGVKGKDKPLLIRPGNFKIVDLPNARFSGKIKNVHFYGEYYELEILLADQLIKVLTTNAGYERGNSISLTFSEEAIWYLNE